MNIPIFSATILVVEDSPENASLLYEILTEKNFSVVIAEDGESALEIIDTDPPDLVLLDILMPGMDGYETCSRIKQNPLCADIPVIFMSALRDLSYKVQGLELGAVDYITKPVQNEEVLARVRIHLKLHSLQRALQGRSEELTAKNRHLTQMLRQQRILLDNSLVGIVFIDAERHMVDLNRQLADMFGYTREELRGTSTQCLFSNWEDYELLGKQAYPVLQQGEAYEIELPLQRKDGSRFWCRLRGHALNPLDAAHGFVWNMEDISVRKRAEAQLGYARQIFDSMVEGVIVTDPANSIVQVNPAFSTITGYSAADAIGKKPNLLSSGRHDTAFYKTLWDELLNRNQWEGEIWNRRKDGTVYPAWAKIRVVRQHGSISHFTEVFQDISSHKVEQARRQHMASHDPLTDLPDRGLFQERLKQTLAQAENDETLVAVLYIHLKGVAHLNHALGHPAGDRFLVVAAENLRRCLHDGDMAARLGGAYFGVVMRSAHDSGQLHTMMRDILAALNLQVEQDEYTLDLCAGIVALLYPLDENDPARVVESLDSGLEQARRQEGNRMRRLLREDEAGPQAQNLESGPRLKIAAGASPAVRILCVEDDSLDAMLVQSVLEAEGYAVASAQDGAGALQAARRDCFDLILLDYQLPDMNGTDVLQALHQAGVWSPIVVVTAEEGVGTAVEAMKNGATDYLRKDPDLVGLLPAVVARALTSTKVDALQLEAEEARAGQALYSSIFESAFVAFFIMNHDGMIVEANHSACQLCGYTHKDLLNQHGKNLLHPDSHFLFPRFLDTAEPFPVADAKLATADGGHVSVEIQRSKIEYDNKPHLLAMVRDVTERRQAEQRLRLAAVVFEHSPEGVLITDAEQRIVAVNQAFCEITGYRETEVLGQNPSILKSGRHQREFYQSMWARIETSGMWQGEIWNRRKNGELFPAWQDISAVRNRAGEVSQYISIFSDLTERKLTEEKIRRLIHYDVLTGLPNRLLFSEQVQSALHRAEPHKQQATVLYIGLDRFKQVNDTFSHTTGDRLLQIAAQRLAQVAVKENCARMGGDEFAVVAETKMSAEVAANLAGRILSAFDTPFYLEERQIHVSVSIGISLYPQDGASVSALITHANTAMTRAKQQGGHTYQFYAHQLTAEISARLRLENELRHALESNEGLFLEYQPQIDLHSGAIVGAEALVRWHNQHLGTISPGEFIPLAEATGLIIPLGEWVLDHACNQMREWLENGVNLQKISVNVSSLQMERSDIVATTEKILGYTGLPSSSLELEITESLLIHSLEEAVTMLKQLRELNVSVALDDFGTGYSSLTYLQKLPVAKLKLDRAFLQDINAVENREIAAAVITLGRSLHLRVICEGVETRAQEQFLKGHGCHEAQGFFYSPPIDAEHFVALWREYEG